MTESKNLCHYSESQAPTSEHKKKLNTAQTQIKAGLTMMERLSEMKKKKKNLTVVNLFNIDSVYRPGRTNLALSRLHRWWAGMRVLHLCDTVHQKSAPLFSFLVAFQNSHASLENPFLLLYHDVHFNVFFYITVHAEFIFTLAGGLRKYIYIYSI